MIMLTGLGLFLLKLVEASLFCILLSLVEEAVNLLFDFPQGRDLSTLAVLVLDQRSVENPGLFLLLARGFVFTILFPNLFLIHFVEEYRALVGTLIRLQLGGFANLQRRLWLLVLV